MLLHYHLCLDTELRAEPIPWYRARRAFFPLKSHFIVTATYVRSNDPTHVQTLVGELPLNVLLMQRVLGRTLGKLLLTVFFFFYIISVIVTNTDIVMSESAEIAVTVVTSVLIITSIVGNSLVCAVIKKNRDMR